MALKHIVGILLLFCLLVGIPCNAQKEASIWYFGHNAGISFANGSPTVLTNGKIYTDEVVASICDNRGSLLFYTDGKNMECGKPNHAKRARPVGHITLVVRGDFKRGI